MVRISDWKGKPAVEKMMIQLQKQNIVHTALLILYLFPVICIQLFIVCNGQVSASFVLSQLLILTVLTAGCPFLLRKAGCLSIKIREETDRKQGMVWGVSFFLLTFGVLYCWYRAYYPGAFSSENIAQYMQAVSGEYNNGAPILQTLFTFTLPLKLTGKAASVVLFQIAEYSAVIAYMLYVLWRYGGKLLAVFSFLYIMANPVTGNIAVCPCNDTTFAMFAVLLMTLGLQVHITDGKWLDSKAALLSLTLVMILTSFVSFRGILFTVPFFIGVLLHVDRKKKIKLFILFVVGVDIIRSCFYFVNPDTAGIWNYKAEQVQFPVTEERLAITDLAFSIEGDVDWSIDPDMAENDLGLALEESSVRDMLQGYTEYSHSSILRYFFWCAGVVNLLVVIALLCKCKLGKRKDWNKIALALPLLCCNFGTTLLMTWGDFRLFYMSFPVFPVILMILFGKRAQTGDEEPEETAEIPAGTENKIDYQYVLAVIYAGILFAMNFIMIFNINFWSDEGYSIMLSRMSFSEMLRTTAGDVHPPLYYILLQIFGRAAGFRWVSYRFLSLVPYGILMAFALTVIWKRFGKEPAVIWITCASLLNTAVEYNTQVRMYSWGAMFVVMSFYCFYKILLYDRVKDYAGFAAMSLGAAYTHYYCLISVAFFYLILFGITWIKRRNSLLKVLMVCGVTVLAYLPWFFVLLKTFHRTSEGYWMSDVPSLKECLLYLFGDKYQTVFLAAFVLIIAAASAYETVSDFYWNKRAVWLAAGAVSVFGTILTGIIVSGVVRPMFTFRYIYPVSAVAWLMLGVAFAKYKKKAVCMGVIVILLLKGGLPYYIRNYNDKKYEEDRLKAVLAATEGEISGDDVILTDVPLFNWTNIKVYYPETASQFIDADNLGTLDRDTDYWMFLGDEIKNDREQALKEQGYRAVSYVREGNLGRIPVYVYRLSRAYD